MPLFSTNFLCWQAAFVDVVEVTIFKTSVVEVNETTIKPFLLRRLFYAAVTPSFDMVSQVNPMGIKINENQLFSALNVYGKLLI